MKKLLVTAAAVTLALTSFSALAQEQANPPTERTSTPTVPDNMRGMSLSGGWTYDSPGWQTDDSSDSELSKDKGAKKSNKNK